MLKIYDIDFRDDYNGRPTLRIMEDNTKLLIVHPFYSFDANNYGRYYIYYSLDDNFDINGDIEIWVIDAGTFSINDHWVEFRSTLLGSVGDEFHFKVDNTDYHVKRITMDEFKPETLGQSSCMFDYITSMNKEKVLNAIKGYIKIGNAVFAIYDVDWKWGDDNGNNDEQIYTYYPYENEVLMEQYEKYKEYDQPITIHKNATVKYNGTLYGSPEHGIVLCLDK